MSDRGYAGCGLPRTRLLGTSVDNKGQDPVGREPGSNSLEPSRAPVTVDVLHLCLDDFAEVAGGVDEVPVARVDPDVVHGPQFAVSVLVEEDQVAGAEPRLGDVSAFPVLLDQVVGQPLPERPEDHLCVARAVLLAVGVATGRGRQPVVGAQMSPRAPNHLAAHGFAARNFAACGLYHTGVCLGACLVAAEDLHGVGDCLTVSTRAL